MPTRHRKKSSFTFVLLPLLFLAVTVYFGWQSTRGAYGEGARQALAEDRAALEIEHADLLAQRGTLEARVARLRTDALDADLLDERARAQLNLTRPTELVIMTRGASGPATAEGRLATAR